MKILNFLKELLLIRRFIKKRWIYNIYEYDKKGVRVFVIYSEATGKYSIECYRKFTEEELKEIPKEDHWKMKREFSVVSFFSRFEAEINALFFAEKICRDYGFHQYYKK